MSSVSELTVEVLTFPFRALRCVWRGSSLDNATERWDDDEIRDEDKENKTNSVL